ncbi:hypothetical protein PO909_022791 [Leuciscus waleckii]
MVEESDEQRDSSGGAEMAALHQCELIQNMIDISISSLQGLRTKCAASNDLTQQEIRTLEVITTRGAEVQRHERTDPLSRSRALYLFLPIFALQLFIVVHYRCAQGLERTPLVAIYHVLNKKVLLHYHVCTGYHGNTMEFRHYYNAIFLETHRDGI